MLAVETATGVRMARTIRWAVSLALAVVIVLGLSLAGLRLAAFLREGQPWRADAVPGRLVDTAMGPIHVLEAGPTTGRPVLLIHGSVGWGGLWTETMAALAPHGYHVIALDLPPMGYSRRQPDDDYSRQAQARRVLALIDAMEITPIVVAHSFGAGAGVEAALTSPASLSGLVIVDGAPGIGKAGGEPKLPLPLRPAFIREVAVAATITNPLATRALLRLFLYRKDRATDGYLDIIRTPFALEGTTPALARWLPTLIVPPTDARSTDPAAYRALNLPVAVLWGAEDTTTPLAQGEEIARLVPGAKLTVLPGVGHIPQMEDPAQFADALVAALASLGQAD